MTRPKHFADLDAPRLKELIDRSCLSRRDKLIAHKRLIEGENIIDIATLRAVSLDRSAVGKRLRKTIIPELQRVQAI